jgi:hypothetical protein
VNLHGIVAANVGAINPFVQARVQLSAGSTTNADGSRTPEYRNVTRSCQVQALSFGDLRQVEGLNLNGTRRAIYVRGDLDGTVRSEMKGGDLIVFAGGPNRGTWLVALVLEQWPDWCKVAATLQNGG